jgi:hypothetical protein
MATRSRHHALSRRSIGAVLILVALMMSTLAGVAKAATPVEVGWRDFALTGGVNRATADKPQSKVWFADGIWYAGMFHSDDNYRVFKFNPATNNWTTGAGLPVLDPRNASRGDYLFEDNTLWVASTHPTDDLAPHSVDTIRVYRSTFDPATDTYAAATWATIPNTQSVSAAGEGGAVTVTIARDSNGRLWTTWPKGSQVRYSISDDNGTTWSAPAQVPGQIGNSIKSNGADSTDISAVINFGGNIGIMWSDHDDLPDSASNGFYFAQIAAGADPTVAINWVAPVKLPSPVGANDGERADNHINMKVADDGTIYVVTKTGKDTLNCATNQSLPLIVLYKRTPAAVWSSHLVATVGDCGTRPQVALSNQLDVVYVALTSPNGGGAINIKSAPMNGPEALKFRAADTSIQPGTPFIKSATETQIDDASMGKQAVTSASGLLVLANNITAGNRVYLHNRLTLGGAADVTDPAGTITIDAGAASTSSPARTVSLAVPATDAGSSVSQVRIANAAGVDGNGVLNGANATTYAYTTPKGWTLTAGDGLKTVYVQWRDGAGNWSAVSSDTIIYDSVALVGSVSINAGAAFTSTTAVSLDVTASDAGSGVDNVRIANVGTVDGDGVLNGAGASTVDYAATQPWTLTAANGTKTVYVQWQDGNGVWSPVQSDTIVLDTTDPAGTVSINGGASRAGSNTVSVAVAATDNASGVSQVRLANTNTVDGSGVLNGAGATTSAYSTPKSWTLAAGEGSRTVYVQWRDGAGNWSAVVSDSIVVDASLPPFTDIDGSTFYDDIAWLADSGITKGCSPTLFCPNDNVTRGQMAAFLHRALPDLPLGTGKTFIDDNGSTFEEDIEWLSAAGITQGCSPDRFCPNAPVTRGQMAAFLHRALPDLPLGTPKTFTDTAGTFQADITWLSAAGITQGCSPTKFCPNDLVTRGQMAAFLHRAIGDD